MTKSHHPTPTEICALRKTTGLNQTQFGELVGAKLRTAQSWEAEGASGRAMEGATWALLRARVALLKGDEAGALAVLRE